MGEKKFWFACSPFVQGSNLVQVRRKEEKEARRRFQEDQGYEINLTPYLSMFGLGKTLTLIIKVLFVCLSQFCSLF